MTEAPFFSIIVPVYNSQSYIAKCIDSVINQTFTDFELILVNDGSTDNSYSICADYALKERRIVCIDKENGGPSSARNLGLKKSCGNYIVFLDSDDIVSPYWLQAFYDTLKKFGSDICYQGVSYFREEKETIHKPYDCDDSEIIEVEDFEKYFTGKWVLCSATTTKCVRGEIVRNNNIEFNSNISLCEDFLFTCQILNVATTVSRTHHDGYFYRVAGGSLSRRNCGYEKYIKTFENVMGDVVWEKETKLNTTLKRFYISYSLYPLTDIEIYKKLKKNDKKEVYSCFRKYGILSNRKKSIPLKFLCRMNACDFLFNIYFSTILRLTKN